MSVVDLSDSGTKKLEGEFLKYIYGACVIYNSALPVTLR